MLGPRLIARVGLNSVRNSQISTQKAQMSSLAKYVRPDIGFQLLRSLKKYGPELAPPTPAEIPRAIRDLRTIGKGWQDWTVREAWLNALVATEVVCWFFVGECIGKGTLIGYQV